MRRTEDLLPLVFTVLLALYGVYQLKTGIAHTRTMKFSRKKHPAFFWFSVTSSFGLSLFILYVAIYRYFFAK